MTDLSEYKELYIKTSSDLLQQLNQDLKTLQVNFSDESAIERLHRNAHSLKSQSLVMGYQSTGMMCKELEFLFRAMKEKQLVTTEQINQAIADALQNLYHSIESIKANDSELNLDAARIQLQLISKSSH